jgi:hypothetical protein
MSSPCSIVPFDTNPFAGCSIHLQPQN